jgi:Cu+-exporting ATPase
MKIETHPLSTTYTCPMHPEVQQNKAGKCSKCGMELVPQQQEGSGTGTEHRGMHDLGSYGL